MKLVITKNHKVEEVHVSPERSRLVRSAARAGLSEVAGIIWQDPSLMPHVKNYFLEEISSQCASIRGDTSLFGCSRKAIEVRVLCDKLLKGPHI